MEVGAVELERAAARRAHLILRHVHAVPRIRGVRGTLLTLEELCARLERERVALDGVLVVFQLLGVLAVFPLLLLLLLLLLAALVQVLVLVPALLLLLLLLLLARGMMLQSRG